MKQDEIYFLKRIQIECGTHYNIHHTVRDIINEPHFPMHYKRAWYLLEKWTKKNWYEYGTTLDLGWMTDEGMKVNADLDTPEK